MSIRGGFRSSGAAFCIGRDCIRAQRVATRTRVSGRLGLVTGRRDGAPEMPCELRAEQNLMQDHQRREIVFIEDFVDGVEVFDRIGWPIKCLGGPCDKIALERLVEREADRAVFLNIADPQQRGLQDEGMRQGKAVGG